MKITFSPVPAGTHWTVLFERETTTLYHVNVPHSDLDVAHDANDLGPLRNALEARAREKLAVGEVTVLGTGSSLDLLDWEPQRDNGIASRVPEYYQAHSPDSHVPTGSGGTVDLSTEETTGDSIAALDEHARERLTAALAAFSEGRHRASVLHHIRRILDEDAPGQPAIGVVFVTENTDQGYYVHHVGEVLFSDATTEEIDFGDDVHDGMYALYGAQGESTTIAIDLRTGTFDESTAVDGDNVQVRFATEPAGAGRTGT